MENQNNQFLRKKINPLLISIILLIIVLGVGGYLLFTKNNITDTTLTNNEVHIIIDQLLEKNADDFYLLSKTDRDKVIKTINDENIYFETELLSLLDTTLTKDEAGIIVDNLLNRENVETFFDLSDADQNLVIMTIISSGELPDNDFNDVIRDLEEKYGYTGYKGWEM